MGAGWVLFCLLPLSGCSRNTGEDAAVKSVIERYNQLLIEGYRKQNMNPMQEVATAEQAQKLYHHMAALGEAQLRMESTLRKLQFASVTFPKPGEAKVETRETWDFTQVKIATGEKYYAEKDFIYEMGYQLQKEGNRWLITNVDTISGKATNTILPRPESDRLGHIKTPGHDEQLKHRP
jgi:hypothetical protein